MVEITYLAIIGIAVAAMFFGYGFGLFEGRNQGYKRRKKEEVVEAAEKPVAEAQPVPLPEPVKIKVDDPGLLRIKNEGGDLCLDLDGSRVDTTAMTTEQRKRLIEMLNLMRPWLEGRPAAPAAAPAPVQSQPVPASGPGQSTPVMSPSVSQPPAPIPPPAIARPATMAKEDRPAAPAGSIVSQIDSILQARLVGTPLEERGVFLAQSPEGGVVVYVGLTKYMGLNEVPDPEIKAAIRSAITEWENKYTPGL
jgi:hypothetical protein